MDSGCSGHMKWDEEALEDFEAFDGGYVSFGMILRVEKQLEEVQ